MIFCVACCWWPCVCRRDPPGHWMPRRRSHQARRKPNVKVLRTGAVHIILNLRLFGPISVGKPTLIRFNVLPLQVPRRAHDSLRQSTIGGQCNINFSQN